MRTDRGALAVDGVGGARYGGRKADAVFGVADIVVHRLRNADHLDALLVEMRGVAQRVVAADGDQVIDLQLLDVLQHLRRHVVNGGGDALLGVLGSRERSCPRETPGPSSS
jgi:hypothetical protein